MNIIYRITQHISQSLNPSSMDIDEAIKASVELMNEPLSEIEKKDIVAFSKKLESAVCPDFKSIHDEMTTSSIWRIVHWMIRTHFMMKRINELFMNFAGINENTYSTRFTEDGIWTISVLQKGQPIISRPLNSFYGLPLITEIFHFIVQNTQMPE